MRGEFRRQGGVATVGGGGSGERFHGDSRLLPESSANENTATEGKVAKPYLAAVLAWARIRVCHEVVFRCYCCTSPSQPVGVEGSG